MITELSMTREKSAHQNRVENFMRQAGQIVPNQPTVPTEAVRLLRAKLLFEEATKELIYEGLAVNVLIDSNCEKGGWDRIKFEVAPDRQPNLVKIADGCADVKVIATGTLSACGIADQALQLMIDDSNIAKFKVPRCPKCGAGMELLPLMQFNGKGYQDTDSMWGCLNAGDGHPYLPRQAGGYKSDGTDGNTEGKWVKPGDWVAPDIAKLLADQALAVQSEGMEIGSFPLGPDHVAGVNPLGQVRGELPSEPVVDKTNAWGKGAELHRVAARKCETNECNNQATVSVQFTRSHVRLCGPCFKKFSAALEGKGNDVIITPIVPENVEGWGAELYQAGGTETDPLTGNPRPVCVTTGRVQSAIPNLSGGSPKDEFAFQEWYAKYTVEEKKVVEYDQCLAAFRAGWAARKNADFLAHYQKSSRVWVFGPAEIAYAQTLYEEAFAEKGGAMIPHTLLQSSETPFGGFPGTMAKPGGVYSSVNNWTFGDKGCGVDANATVDPNNQGPTKEDCRQRSGEEVRSFGLDRLARRVYDQAKDAASRLLVAAAPKVQPDPTLLGIISQLDNLIAGFTMPAEVPQCNVALNEQIISAVGQIAHLMRERRESLARNGENPAERFARLEPAWGTVLRFLVGARNVHSLLKEAENVRLKELQRDLVPERKSSRWKINHNRPMYFVVPETAPDNANQVIAGVMDFDQSGYGLMKKLVAEHNGSPVSTEQFINDLPLNEPVPLTRRPVTNEEGIDDSFRQSFNGIDWARAFIKTFPVWRHWEDVLMGWFANAIMRGYDERSRKLMALNLASHDLQAIILESGDPPLEILYTNHRGVTELRHIIPVDVPRYETTEWHPTPQWLVDAIDTDYWKFRTFAMQGFSMPPNARPAKRVEVFSGVIRGFYGTNRALSATEVEAGYESSKSKVSDISDPNAPRITDGNGSPMGYVEFDARTGPFGVSTPRE